MTEDCGKCYFKDTFFAGHNGETGRHNDRLWLINCHILACLIMSDLHSQTIHTGGEREISVGKYTGTMISGSVYNTTVAVQPYNKGWVTMLY